MLAAQCDSEVLAKENLTEKTNHPFLIEVNGALAGFVVFSDEVSVPLLDEVRIGHTNVMTREQWKSLYF